MSTPAAWPACACHFLCTSKVMVKFDPSMGVKLNGPYWETCAKSEFGCSCTSSSLSLASIPLLSTASYLVILMTMGQCGLQRSIALQSASAAITATLTPFPSSLTLHSSFLKIIFLSFCTTAF